MENEIEIQDGDGQKKPNKELLQKILDLFHDLDDKEKMRIINTIITYYQLNLQTPNDLQEISNKNEWNRIKTTFSDDSSISPKEFVLEKQPQTDVERVACLAYYLTHYKKQPHFKTIDISFINTEAAQRKFTNAAKAVDNAYKYGYLVQANKGMKQLSAQGELFVQALPDRVSAKDIMDSFRKKKRTKQARHNTLNIKEENN